MNKDTVKRCIRPQCMEIYREDTKNRYCDCGALLQYTEIESNYKKNNKKPYANTRKDSAGVSGIEKKEKAASLFLLLEDGREIEFKLGNTALIGRTVDSIAADIDLDQYSGNQISRRHAKVSREPEGYYITNLSRKHSVHINEKALAFGEKILLKPQDAVILSRKFLLQFEEGE